MDGPMAADSDRFASPAPRPEQDWSALRATLEKAVGRVCPPWLREAREDLVQVALLRVMEIERRSEGKREFSSSYLMKVAYSALIDEIRRRRRRRETALEDDAQPATVEADQPDPEHQAQDRQAGRAIQDCLAALIRPRRLAVTLHLRGHGVPEAARILGYDAKRTENLTYRGLKDLRDCLSAKGFAR